MQIGRSDSVKLTSIKPIEEKREATGVKGSVSDTESKAIADVAVDADKTDKPSLFSHKFSCFSNIFKGWKGLKHYKIKYFSGKKEPYVSKKQLSKKDIAKTKMYLKEIGYNSKEIKKITEHLKSIIDPDSFNFEKIILDYPEKKYKELGYYSQKKATEDHDLAYARLLEVGYNDKEIEGIISRSREDAPRGAGYTNHFNESIYKACLKKKRLN